ncbi:phage tail tape measure protein [Methylocystis hirsuta]|uniref:Phage tail tape measure protein n=1 Tax=Methylocystis hirsuta TaxID=369798 RepID=A0A3M9XM53_9HYPH|nr:phage tail tape measure protein [Methylocystis hirsuta]RNJ49359.1 phage tail tape measure protein [Methylocystis hirsuta]
MRTFETAAVISLIDHLSGPLQQLANKVAVQQNRMASMGKSMVHAGQHMTWAVTLPLTLGLERLAHASKEFSEQENTFRGVIENRARIMGLGKEATESYLRQQEQVAKGAEALGYNESRGMLDALEYRKAIVQGVKANMDAEQAAASATASFHLALAGRIDQHEANERLINVAQAFGLITKNVDGSNKSFKEMLPQFQRYSDLLAVMSSNSNMTVDQAADALKLSAPLAHMTHTNAALIAAMHEAQAEMGIKGSEAGVNVRSWMLSLVAPKSTAVPAMLQHGVDLNKYFGYEGLSPEGYVGFMRGKGIDIAKSYAAKMFAAAHDDEGSLDITKLVQASVGHLRRTGKKGSTVNPDLAEKYSQQYFNSHMASSNIMGVLLALREAHLPPGAMASMMEKRQIPRSWAYLMKPTAEEAAAGKQDVFAQAMRRAFGEMWEQVIRTAASMSSPELRDEYLQKMEKFHGTAMKMSGEHGSGMEGAFIRLSAAFTHLKAALHDSGAMKFIEDGINKVADLFDRMAGWDAASLGSLVKGMATLAAVGPALIAIGLAMQAIGAIGAGPAIAVAAIVTALMNIPGVAEAAKGAVQWLVGEAIPGIAGALQAVANGVKAFIDTLKTIFNDHMKLFSSWMDGAGGALGSGVDKAKELWNDGIKKGAEWFRFKDETPLKAPSQQQGDIFRPASQNVETGMAFKSALDNVASAVRQPVEVGVEGNVRGAVDIHQSIRLDPSPLFLAKMSEAQNAVARVEGSIVKLGRTMSGGGNAPARSGGSVLAPAPAPLKL